MIIIIIIIIIISNFNKCYHLMETRAIIIYTSIVLDPVKTFKYNCNVMVVSKSVFVDIVVDYFCAEFSKGLSR
jgi:uncharacterized protein YggT (Ycf19 family)